MTRPAFLMTVFLAWPAAATADQAIECMEDADCAPGLACGSNQCIPADRVCATTTDCGAGEVCDVATTSCAAPRCQDGTVNGYCQPLPGPATCRADRDCAYNELCWVKWAPVCADGDAACAPVARFECTEFEPVCDRHATCPEGVACRAWSCNPPHHAPHVATLDVDHAKDMRLRAVWSLGACAVVPERHPACPPKPQHQWPTDDGSGCAASPGSGTAGSGAAVLLLVAVIWYRRSR